MSETIQVTKAQEIAGVLRSRGLWCPPDSASSDLIGAVAKAIDELRAEVERLRERLESASNPRHVVACEHGHFAEAPCELGERLAAAERVAEAAREMRQHERDGNDVLASHAQDKLDALLAALDAKGCGDV